MDYTAILKRAFHITKKYRALWVFGILLALFGGGSSGGSRFNFGGNPGNGTSADMPFGGGNPFGAIDPTAILTVALALVCIVFILVLAGIVLVPVLRTALIGMVNEIEAGEKVAVKTGWRIGWSREAWKVFLVSFLINLPLVIFIVIAVALVVAPFMLGIFDKSLLPLGIGLGIMAVIAFILLMILISLIVKPILELSWRYAALRYTGARESIGLAFQRIRTDFKRVAISALVMFGVDIVGGIVLFFAMVVVLILGALLAAVPALLGYILTQEITVALLAGVPFFLLIVFPLGLFAGGLYQTYHSTAWTLIFNELEMPEETDASEPTPPELPETVMPEDNSTPLPEDSDVAAENSDTQPPENLTL